MLDKLKTLPIDQLFALRDKVNEACQLRQREVFKHGRLITWTGKAGEDLIGTITGIGPVNLQAQVLDEDGRPVRVRGLWRLSPNLVTPLFKNPFVGTPGSDKPRSPDAGVF